MSKSYTYKMMRALEHLVDILTYKRNTIHRDAQVPNPNQFQYRKMLLLAAQINMKRKAEWEGKITEKKGREIGRGWVKLSTKWEYLCWWCQAQWEIGWFWQIVKVHCSLRMSHGLKVAIDFGAISLVNWK